MRPAKKIQELELRYGNLHDLIPKRVSEVGQKRTAEEIGVRQSFISDWLRANGYFFRIVWERKSAS